MSRPRCQARIRYGWGIHHRQCLKTATHGKFCKVHDPAQKAERREQKIQRSQAKLNDRLRDHLMLSNFHELRDCLQECLSAINFEGDSKTKKDALRRARDRANRLLANIAVDLKEAEK